MRRYVLIDHTSDIAVKVRGKTREELFTNSAYAMFDILADLEGLRATTTLPVNVEGADYEDLLVRWLDELLYIFYTKGLILSAFSIKKLTGQQLQAIVNGRYVNENRNRLKAEIKAVTYHDVTIKKEKNGYTVKLVFDV